MEGSSVRKRSNGLATYHKIVEATVTIMRQEGPGGVTTARLAHASGIVQSGFYTHFKNVDEAIVAAAEHSGQRLRDVIQTWRSETIALRNVSVRRLAEHYEALLELLLGERHFTELYLQYRRSPSTLGEVLRQFEADVLYDISVHLGETFHPSEPLREVDRQQAEQIVGMFWVAVDRALYTPEADPKTLALELAVLSKVSLELSYAEPDERFLSRVTLGLLK